MFRQAPVIASAAVTYFVVRIRVNALTAISLFLLMVVVGVDHAPLWAVGAFFLSFVPYLGLILALIPPTILAFAESARRGRGDRDRRNRSEPGRRERPRADAHRPRIVTCDVACLRDVLLLGLADGPIGALLSMPISVLIVLVLRHSERTRWIAELLAREGEHTAEPERDVGSGAGLNRRSRRTPGVTMGAGRWS